MVRPYKIPGLHYCVDLCFVAQKAVIEVDEDNYLYYENGQIPEKSIEDHGFTLIRINPVLILKQVSIWMLRLQKYTNTFTNRL